MTLKREIKDAYLEGGNSIYVKTHSNAIYVDDNETETLTKRLDNIKDSIKEHTTKLETITAKVTEINVKEFGAKGDAYYFDINSKKFYVDSGFTTLATDDSIYFQNAINTLIKNGGGRLTIPKGNYYFANSVYINPPKPGISIELSGIASRTGWEDYWTYDNGVYKKGVNILCDVENVFLTNCKEDGNQYLGS